jgi:hypothetical protein
MELSPEQESNLLSEDYSVKFKTYWELFIEHKQTFQICWYHRESFMYIHVPDGFLKQLGEFGTVTILLADNKYGFEGFRIDLDVEHWLKIKSKKVRKFLSRMLLYDYPKLQVHVRHFGIRPYTDVDWYMYDQSNNPVKRIKL